MCRACYSQVHESNRGFYDPFAEFDREVGLFESEFEGGWSAEDPSKNNPPGRRGTVVVGSGNPDFQRVLGEIRKGNRNRSKLIDLIFYGRYPCLNQKSLKALTDEWKEIGRLVDAALGVPLLNVNPAQLKKLTRP